MNELGNRIAQARERAGLSKAEVCRITGIPYRTYCSYEYGEREPSSAVIVKLAEIYACTVGEFYDEKKAPEEEAPVISKEELIQFLEKLGICGDDLSNADLLFVESLIAAATEWFSNRNA